MGEVHNRQIILSPIGKTVEGIWQSIPLHFPQASVNHYVIMPNHIHGIIIIDSSVEARHAVPQHAVPHAVPQPLKNLEHFEKFGKPVKGSIPTIIRSFKSEATRRVNIMRQTPGESLWQKNYYEHVIRNEKEFQAIYDYILANPINWRDEKYFG